MGSGCVLGSSEVVCKGGGGGGGVSGEVILGFSLLSFYLLYVH